MAYFAQMIRFYFNIFFSLYFIGLSSYNASAQSNTQTVKGQVFEKDSRKPIGAASLSLQTETGNKITLTDSNGHFRFEQVPAGRHILQISHTGFKSEVMNNLIVTSGKEVVLMIDLEDDIEELQAVKVRKSGIRSGNPNNDLALVSARQFTVDETDRYAGSRGDPARMASNFAGVQGADDSRNDIVIRGNSPQGVLWRLEGADIPNPNHFAVAGTTGGPVSIFNNNVLANSDFFTGAFPAEYGNSIAGVFDIKLRNGNAEKREYSTQLGFLGWNGMTEGPIHKKSKASYLFSYRYSTLALFSKLNIPLGTNAIPKYQDGAYKLHFPIKNKGHVDFFGIGGNSEINILVSDKLSSKSGGELYGDDDRDQHFLTNIAINGMSAQYRLNNKTFLQWTSLHAYTRQDANHQLVFRSIFDSTGTGSQKEYKYRIDSIVPNLDYTFRTHYWNNHIFIQTKVSKKLTLKGGIQISRQQVRLIDSARSFDSLDAQRYWNWYKRWDTEKDVSWLWQPYFQLKYRINARLLFTSGLHWQYSTLGKSGSLPELRAGIKWNANSRHSFSLGGGMHSQTQPLYTYYYIIPGNTIPHNMNMKLTRSNQIVASWDVSLRKDLRSKVEVYYQALGKIPVSTRNSSLSLVNTGAAFSRFFPDTLVNKGIAENYGIEFTLEKFFTKGYYYLVTFSLFEARYQGSDQKWRPSDFNTGYAFNALLTKEFKMGKKQSINVGGKLTMAGARRYSPIDTLASIRTREYVELDAAKNSLRFGQSYFRFDVRLAYRINAKKISHEFALDLVNTTNRQNILKYSFTLQSPFYKLEYQLGFLPLFYYRIDF